MARVMREVPAHTALELAAQAAGYKTAAAVARALGKPPYNIRVGRGYIAGIFNGDRFNDEHQPGDELFAALLHLVHLNLDDLGMDPGDRPAVYAAVAWAREHGWPQRRGGGGPPDDGTVTANLSNEQVNRPIRSKGSYAGQTPSREILVPAGIGACVAGVAA
jgi:hypothetical protein